MTTLCSDIATQVGSLFRCTDSGEYVRIRTPFLYPDGDVIDLFAKNGNGSSFTLTDLGETLGWLRMQTLANRRSPKQNKLIEDVALTHGIEIYRGMLTARVRAPEELGATLMRLGQAAVRMSDLWFTFRTRAIESLTDEVAELFAEKEVPFQRGEQLVGRSGRVYRPDFHTRLPEQSALLFVLTTASSAAANRIVDHVYTAWADLNQLKIGPEALKFVSLFDDTANVWSEENIRLVSDVSDIAFWSRPDDLLETIAA